MSSSEINIEDWNSNRKLVLLTLERIERKVDNVDLKVDNQILGMALKINTLETNWKLYTAIISVVVGSLVAAIVSLIFRGFG